jgi:hypothetical protein
LSHGDQKGNCQCLGSAAKGLALVLLFIPALVDRFFQSHHK